MTHKYLTQFSTTQTPQATPIPGREQEMVENSAGGFVFPVDDWKQLERFLILGSEGGTYYISEQKLTQENAQAVLRCVQQDGIRVVKTVADISDKGRAPKNDPALFTLAMAAGMGNTETRRAAFAALPRVARIPTHLFHFATFMRQFRGWGRAARSAIASWYLDKPLEQLALHMVKYQQRDGWANADLLRLAHPKTPDRFRNEIFKYIVDGDLPPEETPDNRVLFGADRAKKATNVSEVVKIIREYGLPRECVPTQYLNDKAVWQALLDVGMGIHALVRNLGKMTAVGLVAPFAKANTQVLAALGDKDRVVKARLHPLVILAAQKVYEQGHGEKGKLSWSPVAQITDALDAAFYYAFGAVEPVNRPVMLALDVSGSMGYNHTSLPGVNCAAAAAAMALVTANVESNYAIMGFANKGLVPLDISPRMRLADAIKKMQGIPFGGTDCSLPATVAREDKLDVAGFYIYTDNEGWAGMSHPTQALAKYRRTVNPGAKQAVIGMQANKFTISDPKDAGQLDVVGFDTSVPAVLADFIRN